MKYKVLVVFFMIIGISVIASDIHVNKKLTVCFAPEGGRLVAGIRTWVAFEMRNENGQAVASEGVIYNQKGEQIVKIGSYEAKGGVFQFTPQEGRYYAQFYYGDTVYYAALPKVYKEGYGLEIDNISWADKSTLEFQNTSERLECLDRILTSWNSGTDRMEDWSLKDSVGDVPIVIWSLQRNKLIFALSDSMYQAGQVSELAKYEAIANQYMIFSDEDLKLRVSRTEKMTKDSLCVSLWKGFWKLKEVNIGMQNKESYVRFLLKELPEGELEVRLTNKKQELLCARKVDICHYQRAHEYRERKGVDIEMMLKNGKMVLASANIPEDRIEGDLKVCFCPEGGEWIAGVPVMVAFQVENADEKGVKVWGTVYNEKMERIAFLSTGEEGMGMFRFTPAYKATYVAELVYQGKLYKVNLPNIEIKEGYGMEVDNISMTDDLASLGEYTPDRQEQMRRFLKSWGGWGRENSKYKLPADQWYTDYQSMIWFLWMSDSLKRCPFQGKYLPVPEEYNNNSLSFYDEDIKVRIGRTVNMGGDSLILSIFQNNHELDWQHVDMKQEEGCLRFLRRNLPEGELEIRLADRNGKILKRRLIEVRHYSMGHSYWQAKIRDIGYILKEVGDYNVAMECKEPFLKNELQVRLFPEGGVYLQGVHNKFGFKVENEDKQPVNGYGIIRNAEGRVWEYIETFQKGFGEFSLVGGKDTCYVDFISNDKIGHGVIVPAVQEGYILTVREKLQGVEVCVLRKMTGQSTVSMELYHEGRILKTIPLDFKDFERKKLVMLSSEDLPCGNIKLCLIDSDGKIWCTRDTFIKPGRF